MNTTTRNLHISPSFLLCAVTLHWLSFTGFAQPHYVQVGTLPVSTASERGEVFDATTGTLLSFPYYNSGDLTSVYSTQPGSNDSFSWTATTSFQPARTTYWGRGASDGSHLYFSGTIDSVSMYVSIGAGGLLGPSWQTMTPLPTPAGGRGRSLHQSFIYQGRLYVLGGWYGDGLPLYADAYYAPILTGGALGSFVQTTSLPVGMCGHSATVSAAGEVYVAYGTNLFLARIAADGSIGSWVTQPTIAGMNHNNYGNTGMAIVSNLLVIVDYSSTFVCQLNTSGQVYSVAATITNPAYFDERSVYVNNGKVYVTAATGTNYYPRVGNIYRVDGLPTGSGACAPTPLGIVAWWPGDGNAIDIVGDNNGTLVNGVSFAPGVVGQAFSFDGGAKTGISVPDTRALELTNSLTIEAWVKITALTNTIDGMILFRGDDRGGLDPYALAISGGSTAAVFHVCASVTSEFGITAPVPFGPFFHLAATLDDSSGQMSLYVNGSPAAQHETTVRPFGDLDPTANPGIGIGNIQGLPASVYSSPFHGLIDELRVYSRALSASEIKAIADAGPHGLCSTLPASITTPPRNNAIRTGESATLSVTATGSLPLAYQWYQGVSGNTNGLIAGATNSVYTASGLSTNTSFWVSVQNVLRTVDSSTATVTVVSAETPILGIETADGLAWLTIDALPGTLYRVECSTNLFSTNWTTLTIISLSSTPYTYIDATSAKVPMRFYRLVTQ